MKDYKELLKVARDAINSFFDNKKIDVSVDIKKKFSRKQCCFVTLTKNGKLRGCIGSLEAKRELWRDIIENSINTAFKDPRFLPLTKEEFNEVNIEISILSAPYKLEFNGWEELLKKLTRNEGVILKKGFYEATYLPQVWDIMPSKEEFMESLCLKAGLDGDEWKRDIEVFVYGVEKVKEQQLQQKI